MLGPYAVPAVCWGVGWRGGGVRGHGVPDLPQMGELCVITATDNLGAHIIMRLLDMCNYSK